MKIVQLHFCLVVCCGATDSFTEKLVNLGQNVTLQCEVDVKHVYWFLMKPSEPPVFILRSFSSRSLSVEYSNQTFNKTFSLQHNSSLFIHNISTNELGVYYCSPTPSVSPPNISHEIRLYIRNYTADNSTSKETHHQNQTHLNELYKCGVNFWRSLFFTLGILNCLVLVVVIVRLCRKRSTNHQARPSDPGIQQSQQENNIHIYDVVLNSPPDRSIGMNMLSSTYALLQPARPPS
ncbi:uncharacterized protein LOC124379998 [Silurus meridionalis]|uniref:uncharacterized protein LOC124379998 n=1 Tax=Silurus meridionalis TaxID=175797 RepID=UPI001EECF2B7|nr:uncharacterized protein LOC124379998 [Silurus meridionalis]